MDESGISGMMAVMSMQSLNPGDWDATIQEK